MRHMYLILNTTQKLWFHRGYIWDHRMGVLIMLRRWSDRNVNVLTNMGNEWEDVGIYWQYVGICL